MALVVVDKSKPLQDIEGKPGIVGSRYYVDKRIGEGSFGVIYKGIECRGNYRVAIKFENRKTVTPQLRDEFRTYRMLNEYMKSQQQYLHQRSLIDGKLLYGGVPTAYFFGQDSLYNCLVMDLLGPSLEELFDQCGRKFTIPTVCQIAIQMLYLVEMIHNCGLIYRDIKPDNFLIGPDNLIYVVDFGMAKAYRDPRTLQHIPYREKKSLSGTARYMSINTHLGREQSRRDDLEALGHVFFYFLRGSLPWQGLKAASNKEKYEKIGLKKEDISVAELCNGFPDEFAQYLTFARGMKFDSTPDYGILRDLMEKVLSRYGITGQHHQFDWMNYRSTWEPEILAKIGEGELNRLKKAAIESTAATASIPVSPTSIGSSTFMYNSCAESALPSAHRPVAVFKDSNNYNYNYSNRKDQEYARRNEGEHGPFTNLVPEMERNSSSNRNWFRRLFCL